MSIQTSTTVTWDLQCGVEVSIRSSQDIQHHSIQNLYDGEKRLTVLPKKRKHQMTVNATKTNMFRYQALWYSAFAATYIWFLYCVAYDFFILQKYIFEVDLLNFIGAILSIVFILSGTKIFKPRQIIKEGQKGKSPKKLSAKNSTCHRYIGFLNQRHTSKEIPLECLTCENVIQCFSSTR